MIHFRKIGIWAILITLLCIDAMESSAQLSALNSSLSTNTDYTSTLETDIIYFFCSDKNNPAQGELTYKSDWEGTKTYLWEKFDQSSLDYSLFQQESIENGESTISNLEDGLYRITITQGGKTKIAKAWVLNIYVNNINVNISESTCESFKLNGDYSAKELIYYDPSTGENIKILNSYKSEWQHENNLVSTQLSTTIYNLPPNDTQYRLVIKSEFGCEFSKSVIYESLVPEAKFSISPKSGEAPLIVEFKNQSVNATPGLYEWRLFRDLNEIKRENENNPGGKIDSFFYQPIINDEFQYPYETTGLYNVKLIARKQTGNLICADTTYLKDLIVVDSSFVDAPNFFSPNGDGTNDNFVVAFHSMEDIKVSIFNRWGKKLHYWEKSNIQGFENSYTESVWDGKVNNRYVSPGVYYYIVKGRGRDGVLRREKGFFHLFRDR